MQLMKLMGGIGSKAASYALSLRWAGDCAAVWKPGAVLLLGAMLAGLLMALPALTWGAGAFLAVLVVGVGVAAYGPLNRPDGVIEVAMQRRAAEAERRVLARAGLTPEEFLAAFPESMAAERSRAAQRLGISDVGRL